MPLDLTSLSPTAGKGLPSRRSSRTTGPNPFLDGFPISEQNPDGTIGTLAVSYETEQDYAVEAKGEYIDTVKVQGPRKGEPTQRLTGDASRVVSMLRMAANTLGVGVRIDITPAKRKGFLKIQYLGTIRKVYGKRKGTEDEYEDE